MSDKKHPTSIRLSDEAKRLQKLLSQKLGVSQAAVLELAIRELAKRENVK
jgi:predicted DNA-binding protein